MEPLQTELVQRGRRTALIIAGVLVGIDLMVAGMWIARFGTDEIGRLLVRLVLAIGLAVALYRGFAWARWTLLVLLLAALLLTRWSVPSTAAEFAAQWPMVVMIIAWILIGRTLLYSKSLAAFMRHQRGEPLPDPPAA
jgi:lysylphosphatidylglycerol synthetase-like protein (DUF2156 family)